MTSGEIRDHVLQALRVVAPEVEPSSLRPDVPFRDQIDIDSMDALRFAIELHRRVGVDIPEKDYRLLATLDDAVAYVSARLQAGTAR